MRSLKSRLSLAATVVMAFGFGLIGWTLDGVYQRSAEQALRDRLQGQVYALMAAAEFRAEGTIAMPNTLPRVRFSTPWAGLYAQISDARGAVVWQSHVQPGLSDALPSQLNAGESRFVSLLDHQRKAWLTLSFGLVWQDRQRNQLRHNFSVAEREDVLADATADYRRSLWSWLTGVMALLLVLLWSILHWGLRPLRRTAEDLKAMESGQTQNLAGPYPTEIQGLTNNLNDLITLQQRRLERSRHSLADMAHSLKTPLAVIAGTLDQLPGPSAQLAQEQLTRINQIMEYQFQRASSAGGHRLGALIRADQVIDRLLEAQRKVYGHKGIEITQRLDPLSCHIDEGDLLELAGNIIDNACKYGQHSVRVRLSATHGGNGVELSVEDDGPGIAPELRTLILQRGMRASDEVPGQGIGLAVVQDLVQLYDGEFTMEAGTAGGTRVRVRL